ncbi:hypothetical protein V9K67_23040 [Paraflavisolibacter sp. H34]|uniref:hypothetical protein n=1 Tax=Huijunlia imazamoxiresistens TaxID=3127457 RepID=UPI003017C145
MHSLIPKLTAFLFLLLLAAGCKKGGHGTGEAPIDWAAARMQAFELAEGVGTVVSIEHPQVQNDVETVPGKITLVLPRGYAGRRLTPLATNFTGDVFTVAPRLGELQDFSLPVLYTLRSTKNPARSVHYQVIVSEEPVLPDVPARITYFGFEKRNNPGLSSDIAAFMIDHGFLSFGKIFVFVPAGTNFSALKPTIHYQGAGLYYSQDPGKAPAEVTDLYPASGLSIDFAYPKVFYAIVKKGDEVMLYDVIVDVRDPIQLEAPAATLPHLAKGSIHFLEAGGYVNRGNHPIAVSGVTHAGQVPVNTTAIRASAVTPSGGVLPGRRTVIHATVNAQVYPPGTYQTAATFQPSVPGHPELNGLLQSATMTLAGTIVD